MYCNARKSGNGDLQKREPAEEHAGDGYCGRTAGAGTEHTGRGRCKHHGGLSGDDDRVTHGFYSENMGEVLREKIETVREADIESIEEEIYLMRALLANVVEGMSDDQLADAAPELIDQADKVTRNIERLHKIRYGEKNTITVQEVDVFVSVVMDAVQENFERCENAEEMLDVIGDRIAQTTGEALEEPANTRGGHR